MWNLSRMADLSSTVNTQPLKGNTMERFMFKGGLPENLFAILKICKNRKAV